MVELSLNPAFRRHYTALYKGVAEAESAEKMLAQLVGPHLPQPLHFPFWLLGVDVTSQPRPFSPTLQDRRMVYQPNQVQGKKPVTVGHRFSTVALLAERQATAAPWVVPLANARVESIADKELRGAAQVDRRLCSVTLADLFASWAHGPDRPNPEEIHPVVAQALGAGAVPAITSS